METCDDRCNTSLTNSDCFSSNSSSDYFKKKFCQWDIFYPCQDKKCNFFTPVTLPPDKQLNLAIEDGGIKAIASTPNLFEFNVKLDKFNLDLLKLSESLLPDEEILEEEDETLPGAIPLIWFLVVVVGIIRLAWIFYQSISKYEGNRYI